MQRKDQNAGNCSPKSSPWIYSVALMAGEGKMLHKNSCPCLKSELDLFSVPDTDISIESSLITAYEPVTTLSPKSGEVSFHIPGNPDEYIDLAHTFLYLRASIVKGNGDKIEENKDVVGPINLALHTLFKNVELSLNNTPVTSGASGATI